jgi:hypothetical protein
MEMWVTPAALDSLAAEAEEVEELAVFKQEGLAIHGP